MLCVNYINKTGKCLKRNLYLLCIVKSTSNSSYKITRGMPGTVGINRNKPYLLNFA